ncbi:MAG: ATP-binding protein [Minwuia sp.]|uniref:ATP-binding protein n=1 Tax=Minwuia sp. TaxID=2493630 RepID=UPI003A841C1A
MSQRTESAFEGREVSGSGRGTGLGVVIGLAVLIAGSLAVLAGWIALRPLTVGGIGLAAAVLILVSFLLGRARAARPAAAVAPPAPAPAAPEPVVAAPAEADRIAELETAARDLAEALDHDRRLAEQVRENAPFGLVHVDAKGEIVRANAAAQRILGYREELVGRPFTGLFSPDVRSQAQAALSASIGGKGDQASTDLAISGGGRIALVHGAPLKGLGDDLRAVFFITDATDQRSMEAQFSQGQRMQAVGQLAGGVAHDFNNLLTAMIGFADLLLMRHPPGDPSYTDIVHIKQNANRAAALVRQLLAFSRRQTLRPKVLNLTDVLTDISELLRRLIGEHLNLRLVHERDLWFVKADQGQIEQVVTNLVVNARDAMDAGGTVSINTANITLTQERRAGDETVPPGDYVEITVADTGTGITDENLSKIFEPFFTTKSIGHGTGLGLATVYGIVRQTGGFVDVESELGVGTTFRIFLPRVDDDSSRGAERTRRNAVDLTGSGTILLVEDEDAVRLFAARALRNKGYELIEAESGEAALEIIESRAEEIDLMISDVVMPNMDGPTLVRHARERRPDIRAVFISGYAEEAFRRSLGDDLQDVDLLPKPFSLKQLAAKVKDQLEG